MRGRALALGGCLVAASLCVLIGPAGAAPEPVILVSPSSHAFGSFCVGGSSSAKTFTITNGADSNGGQDLEITNISRSGSSEFGYLDPTDQGTVTLAPGESETFSATFKPLSSGDRSATFRIESPNATDKTVTVTGTGLDRRFAADRSTVSFGEQRVNTRSPTQTLVIRNTGGDTVTVTSIARRGTHATDFVLTAPGTPFTISKGSFKSITIAFQPKGAGLRSGAVELLSNACSNAKVLVGLVGTGVVPNVLVEPNPIEAGSSPIGKESKPVAVVLTNKGQAPLKITAIQVVGTDAADFSLKGLPVMPVTVPPAGTLEFQVTMTPSAEGLRSATVNVLSDDPDTPAFTVPLRGTAGASSPTPSTRPTASATPSPSPTLSARPSSGGSPQAFARPSNDNLAVGMVVGGVVIVFGGLLFIRRMVASDED